MDTQKRLTNNPNQEMKRKRRGEEERERTDRKREIDRNL